jgi:hypothetical protein
MSGQQLGAYSTETAQKWMTASSMAPHYKERVRALQLDALKLHFL